MVVGLILAAVMAAVQPCIAAEAHGGRAGGAQAYTFAFQEADIGTVVAEILGELGVPYTLDPGVTGKISFRIDQSLTRAQLLAALEAELAANDVAMVRQGERLLITPASKAKSSAPIRQGGGSGLGIGYEVVAVPLAYVEPTEVSKALEAIAPSNTVLYANDRLGLLLLGGSGESLKSAIDSLRLLDQSAFQDSKVRWFELNQAPASAVASELDHIIQNAGMVGTSVLPMKRLNGVIVFTRSAEAMTALSGWVQRLDVPGRDGGSSLFVYHPRNTQAEALGRALNAVFGHAEPAEDSTPPSTGPGGAAPASTAKAPSAPAPAASAPDGQTGDQSTRFSVDKETNTLLVFAAPSDWVQIQRILAEIDRPPRQVLIEASILEVTLGRTFRLGVDWSVLSKDVTVSSIGNKNGLIGAQYPGFSVTYLTKDVQAAINALGSKTAVEVVSAPKIIALDNHTARLQVGDQVPIITESAQSTVTSTPQVVNSVDYRSTGVILTVTPRISGDDQLVLDVAQEVSAVSPTTTSGIDSPTIQQRKFESTLILHDGGTVALGGLISTNRSHDRAGVPVLKNVPGLGALFRNDNDTDDRTELIVLLKAKIMGAPSADARAMSDLAADMYELRSHGLLPAAP